jgi:cell wall-associated NlpC family hydrolase
VHASRKKGQLPGLCVVALAMAVDVPAISAQEPGAVILAWPQPEPQTSDTAAPQVPPSARRQAVATVNSPPAAAAKPRPTANAAASSAALAAHAAVPVATKKPKGPVRYYVDFRARTAASYGHAFLWYGRTDHKEVDVAGLHPATESVIPYILGHIIPVPSETGASYGDLDEQYVTASYRVYLTEDQAKRVFAYIQHLQTTSPVWHGATYNCVAFIRDVARFMGLNLPASHLLYPEVWVNDLRDLNGGPKVVVKLAPEAAPAPAQPVY